MALAPATVSRDFVLGDVLTAGGGVLHDARLRYRVLGDPDAARANGWILVFHALTGNAEVDSWWGPIVGPGLPLDTSRHAILAANLLGSCYGSTGPAEAAARGDTPFPMLTPADLARAHEPLLASLDVQRVSLATGGSLGGMVALEWAKATQIPADRVVVFAAPAVTSPQSIAWNAAQRMAIEADPAWRGGLYHPQPGPAAGLAAARAIAMITYRSSIEFEARFGRARTRRPDRFDVDSYLRRQGEKLVARFDAASYVALTHTMDLQNVGDHAEAARDTSSRVGEIIGVGIDTDILYPATEVRGWVEAYRPHTNARYAEITSRFGHDAFLIEFDQVSTILRP